MARPAEVVERSEGLTLPVYDLTTDTGSFIAEGVVVHNCDEMDWKLLKAVLGQPMGSPEIPSQTVMSSTHHNPDGTMSRILEMAQTKGWPIFKWGYHETVEPHGWLSRFQLERSRQTMVAEMWRIEVEMEEPSVEGRAIMEDKVEAMFEGELFEAEENVEYEFEKPVEEATYATGADWGQTTDFTEIGTIRTDVRPMRLVAYRYMRRRPYPEMVAKLDERLGRYPGEAAHDYTGVGRVGEFLTNQVEDVTMVGQVRRDLFLNYVLACEREELRAPRVGRLYRQHKYCRTKDLYKSGEDCHPPDGVVMFAMAYKAGALAPVRLLFATTPQQQAAVETKAGLRAASAFLRRSNGNGGNGKGAHP